jgi:UDP-N-acetylmuramoyl-L-alanyl-D-glutamate--2,6-diaminopimelate ligase
MNMKLAKLIYLFPHRLSLRSGSAEISVSSVEYDSRKIVPRSLFVAVKGFQSDGHDFIAKAVSSGAAAVIVDKGWNGDCTVPVIETDDSRAALSYVTAGFCGFPSEKMTVVGITGTNGKTSTTYMLESIFRAAGLVPGVIGTVNYRWGNSVIDAPNTTPESADLQRIFARMYADGVKAVAMEVSSHGLSLGRADDIAFDGALFSNLTRDHLDYHKTFEDYFAAKKKLFSLVAKSGKGKAFAAVNADDPYGKELLSEAGHFGYQFFSYGYEPGSSFHVDKGSVLNRINGISYSLSHNGIHSKVQLPLAGMFHVYNSLAAFSAASALGIDAETILRGLSLCTNVPGRFDTVHSDLGFSVVVDYAHTNDAIEKLLLSVKGLFPRRITTVFGCGGDRDTTKRPLMGQAACALSDEVIITSDNPRTEDPNAIIADILEGIGGYKGKYIVEPDREKAIAIAIDSAKEGDIIVLAGKGHEDYQIIGKTKHHFDDREMARKYIARRDA